MRVWLVDDQAGDEGASLARLLRQLEERPGSGLRLLGVSGFQEDFAAALRKRVSDPPDALVLQERAWPDDAGTQELHNLDLGLVVVTTLERAERFRTLAEARALCFLPRNPSIEALELALLSVAAARQCQARWQNQAARLQQRLDDRILIERAKGILVQKLRISEEDAYRRLRMLSRRQRKQIRDIAQAFLDSLDLYEETGQANGLSPFLLGDERSRREGTISPPGKP